MGPTPWSIHDEILKVTVLDTVWWSPGPGRLPRTSWRGHNAEKILTGTTFLEEACPWHQLKSTWRMTCTAWEYGQPEPSKVSRPV